MELQTIIASPIYVFVASATIATVVRAVSKNPLSIRSLIIISLKYIGICLGLSLAYTIISMWYYEYTTGFSSGNGPLGWIFIYAPLATACGLVLGLCHWLFKDKFNINQNK